MAIGGNEDKTASRESILASFVRRAGEANARVVIIPSASEEPRRRAERYTHIFESLGVQSVHAVHAEAGVTDRDREAIRRATGIFVTGGDQLRLMKHLRDADIVELIRDVVRAGAVYAGTSAGASAASHAMIAFSEGHVVHLDEGLGLVPHVIIDQHFGERQRLPRLQIAAKTRSLVGVGIDEDTAIVWNGSTGVVTVEGAGRVTIVDSAHQLHVLKPGDSRPSRVPR